MREGKNKYNQRKPMPTRPKSDVKPPPPMEKQKEIQKGSEKLIYINQNHIKANREGKRPALPVIKIEENGVIIAECMSLDIVKDGETVARLVYDINQTNKRKPSLVLATTNEIQIAI